MHQTLALSIASLLLLVGCLLLSYGIARFRRRPVQPGTRLAMRCDGHSVQAILLSANGGTWLAHVPAGCALERGAIVLAQAASARGVAVFRTKVLDSLERCIEIEAPGDLRFSDRRVAKRVSLAKASGAVEGSPAQIMDISEFGMKVRTELALRRGERVSVQAPQGGEPIGAYVLDADSDGGLARLRFEETLRFGPLLKRFAPAG